MKSVYCHWSRANTSVMQKHINNIINIRVIFINYSFNEYKYIDKMVYDNGIFLYLNVLVCIELLNWMNQPITLNNNRSNNINNCSFNHSLNLLVYSFFTVCYFSITYWEAAFKGAV